MTDRPGSPEQLELVDRLLASAGFNHLYAFRVHRKLVELDAGGDHTRKLLAESAAIVLAEMPALARDLRTLGSQWSEQELLDPPKAQRTAETLAVRFAELSPKLDALTVRQDEIIAELVALLNDARRA
ncbi:MAG: hypothetical protein ACHQCH_03410 [Solirubrobacterales bacterium]